MLITALALLALQAAPPTNTAPATDTYFGETVTDDYRWLEKLEKDSPEVKAWTDGQLAWLRAKIDSLPCRAPLADALRPLMTIDSWGVPQHRGARWFYTERKGTMNQPALWARTGSQNALPALVIDPNTLDAKGLVSMDWWVPSWDGNLLAYGTSRAGDEMSVLRLLDVGSGQALKDEIPGKVTFGGWTRDGNGFVYSRLTDPKNPYSRVVAFHRLGTPVDSDPVFLRQEKPAEVPFGAISMDDRWVVLGVTRGWSETDLWCATLSDLRDGKDAKTPIAVGRGARFAPVEVVGDHLYMTTTLGSPNMRLVKVDLRNPAESNWKEIVPERKDAVLGGVDFGKDEFVVTWQQDAHDTLRSYRYDGTEVAEIPLPGIGTVATSATREQTEIFFSFASYNSPRTIYRCDLWWKPYKPEVFVRPEVPAKLDEIAVSEIRATSKDGTQVHAFVVMRKDLRMDGGNPCVLYAYGGFDVSLTPDFIPTIVPFLQKGGIYVVANLRGGGEYGEAWHKAGMLGNKQNVFDDLYAVAQKLVDDKYTSSAHLAVMGGSNGGLLTAVAVTQRPELWSAAISAVPLCDMLRYQDFLLAKYWVPEYGSSEDQLAYKWLRAYSPYHNAKKGTKYPAVLFTAGENDSRVHPLHARKMAAMLQACTSSDTAQDPILLYVDRDAGHGQGKPLEARMREAADQWAFLMWQTGACK